MRRSLHAAATLVLLLSAPVGAQVATRRVDVTIDLRAEEEARAALEALQGGLADGDEPVVFLTLKIIPFDARGENRGAPPPSRAGPHAISFRPTRGTPRARLCDNQFDQDGEIEFRTQAFNTHLLLTVRTADPRVMPFASAGCGYDPQNPGSRAFYIRGYYTRRFAMVATSEDIALWPVRPY